MRKENVAESIISRYLKVVNQDHTLSISRRRRLVAESVKSPLFFSWDIPRTREGHYHYDAGIPAATNRALHFAPYADLLWIETATPDLGQAGEFANAIRQQYPRKQLVYNLSPSFDWEKQGFNNEKLRSFTKDLAKHGYVSSFLPFDYRHK